MGVVDPTKNKTKLACILETDESTRMRMGNSIPSNHEDHVAGTRKIHHNTAIWFTSFIPMPQAVKIPAAKAAVDKEWEKLEKISAWNLAKVKSKKKVIDEARTSGPTVHFASSMDICHLKNAELEAKHQKCKGCVVLRGDIAKDNSGSYAVFTEQGSSVSQMTAAKIMDIISRLPGCDGQATHAISTCTQAKNGRCSQIVENSQIGVSRHFGFVYHDTIGLNHGPVWKTQSFLLSEICMVILWQDSCGKGNLRKSD